MDDSKRTLSELRDTELRTGQQDQNKTISEIKLEECSIEKENNLEKYLNDVFKMECNFCIDEADVAFIQCGIETLVQKMADMIRTEGHLDLQNCIDISKEWNSHLMQIPTEDDIVKVGSFYERTRNRFPDEFDFIFIICTFRSSRIDSIDSPELDFPETEVNFTTFEKVCEFSKGILSYTDSPLGKRKLIFDDFVQEHGPAFMLQFTYTNEFCEDKIINVDFVSAFKIVDDKLEENAVKLCKLEPFRDELVSTGGYMYTNGNITFTETEMNFIRNVLSKNHVKVYRLLKYILNGHGDDEHLSDLHIPGYSSYKIKTTIIYHHYSCKNPDSVEVDQCVLDVLGDLYACRNHPQSLVREYSIPPVPSKEYIHCLKQTTDILKSMQCSEETYTYEQCKTKSVCQQLIEGNNK